MTDLLYSMKATDILFMQNYILFSFSNHRYTESVPPFLKYVFYIKYTICIKSFTDILTQANEHVRLYDVAYIFSSP